MRNEVKAGSKTCGRYIKVNLHGVDGEEWCVWSLALARPIRKKVQLRMHKDPWRTSTPNFVVSAHILVMNRKAK